MIWVAVAAGEGVKFGVGGRAVVDGGGRLRADSKISVQTSLRLLPISRRERYDLVRGMFVILLSLDGLCKSRGSSPRGPASFFFSKKLPRVTLIWGHSKSTRNPSTYPGNYKRGR